MNLVAGYGSSSDDEQQQPHQEEHQQQAEGELHNLEGKAPTTTATTASTATGVPPAKTKQPAGTSIKGKKRKSSKKAAERKKKGKTVNALVLSPEIQAALARGDALGDSDSDDEGTDRKPPKVARRPAGSDPKDLLSLLPQPSTAANADEILLKNQERRQDATRPKSTAAAAVASEESRVADNNLKARISTITSKTTTKPKSSGSGNIEGDEADQESESDDGGHDLLAGNHSKSAPQASCDTDGERSSPLFTLPSRARPPSAAAAADLPEADMGAVGSVWPGGKDTATAPGYLETDTQNRAGGQQWSRLEVGQAGAGYGGGEGALAGGAAAREGAAEYAAQGATSIQQQLQAPYYHAAAAQTAVSSVQDAQLGPGKSTRRKGRDMERALARGDLGALGSELPVMDLQQGSNEYNPLRTKPTTAAMKQDHKHIEASVYDPSTGKTVKTLEPTSLQKRKHQINQLAVQAASMERDLMERSGASRLTKAQTHAKYGW